MEPLEDAVEDEHSTLARDPELQQALEEAARCQRASAQASIAWQEAMGEVVTSMASPGSVTLGICRALATSKYPSANRADVEARSESRVANQHVRALLVLRRPPSASTIPPYSP
jgi:hypothetical protein